MQMWDFTYGSSGEIDHLYVTLKVTLLWMNKIAFSWVVVSIEGLLAGSYLSAFCRAFIFNFCVNYSLTAFFV